MRRLLAPSCVLALFICGCSEPPTKELNQAQTAIADARTAGAETYAPEDLQAAEAALQNYNGAVAQRDYRLALNYAQDARDRAYAASRQAAAQKAATLNRANQLLVDVDALMKAATTRLAGGGSGPRLTSQAAERLRTALRTAPQAMQEARALIDQQDYRGAVLRLTPVVEAFRREIPQAELAPGRRGR